MDLGSNTVLITGGASGIGLALAERFLRAGSQVLICGRREEKLREAREKHSGIRIHTGDLETQAGRVAIFERAVREFPRLNVVVHNAGIQRRMRLDRESAWDAMHQEIAINLEAPLHLTTLFLPHLLAQERPAIVFVGSGLAFAPLASVPVYCATKAAIHSFALSLRHQLSATPIQVIEIAPPAVDTDLGGPGLHTFGVSVNELMDAVVPRLQAGDAEIAYGFAEKSSRASREEIDQIFARMNQTTP